MRFIVAGLLALSVLTGCSSAVVTKEEYDQVNTGMSLSQVQSIVGDPGSEMQRTEMNGISIVTQSWQNGGGSNMVCMFQNGALVNKTQIGL